MIRRFSSALAAMSIAFTCMVASSGPANAISPGVWGPVFNGFYTGDVICITPLGNGTANGTVLTTWTCGNEDTSQAFLLRSDGRLVHSRSQKCLTPQGGNSYDNGTVLTLWDCNSSNSQLWVSSNNKVWTQWGGKCITPKGGSFSNGTWLTLWDCNGHPSQYWN
ncbi:RICIN domain-containing protein [Streptomyces sp. NPDC005389]|uniref:RICIN domain-containing protein n=1 Tax=Streptomyces sp. NPDC005389 TaxID=3157040 RepID=UPI0033A83A48